MTEWVTIRIKESVRKDAKADDRTYTEIMADGLTQDGGESVDLDGAIQDELERLVHDASTGGERIGYDDVKSACQKAIRDELPDGVFR